MITSKRPKVLIIDGDLFFGKFLKAKLAQRHIDSVYLDTGDEASAIARREHPDLIIMELVLYLKNGFDVLSELKRSPITKNIPIIVSTTLGMDSDIQAANALGVNKYMIKSESQIDDILRAVERYISNARVLQGATK